MSNTKINKKLARRYAAERRFKFIGACSVSIGLVFLVVLLFTIFSTGFTAFFSTKILLELDLTKFANTQADQIKPNALKKVITAGLAKSIEVPIRPSEVRKINKFLLSQYSSKEIKDYITKNSDKLTTNNQLWLTSSSTIDQLYKKNIDLTNGTQANSIGSRNLEIFDTFNLQNKIKSVFNTKFITGGDSRYPELAGIAGAMLGSFYTLLVCFAVSFPIAVAAAVYLEEFAPKNKFTSFIEININNLAAVPSIIYGLLGLVVVLGFFGAPRSTPLAGGIVLALRTLPTIIIASRAAIRSVPTSIRQAALAMGASQVQVVLHHVLPLSLPGTLTGSIIGLSQALGETAPLLLIGMVAFVVDLPNTPLEPSTTLPVQIYLWAESSERGYVEKTSAAIMIILTFLMAMNSFAIIMRKKYERRW